MGRAYDLPTTEYPERRQEEQVYDVWTGMRAFYELVCPIATTALGQLIFHTVATSPNHYFGEFFHGADGMAVWWAVLLDNLVDVLHVVKGDH